MLNALCWIKCEYLKLSYVFVQWLLKLDVFNLRISTSSVTYWIYQLNLFFIFSNLFNYTELCLLCTILYLSSNVSVFHHRQIQDFSFLLLGNYLVFVFNMKFWNSTKYVTIWACCRELLFCFSEVHYAVDCSLASYPRPRREPRRQCRGKVDLYLLDLIVDIDCEDNDSFNFSERLFGPTPRPPPTLYQFCTWYIDVLHGYNWLCGRSAGSLSRSARPPSLAFGLEIELT